MKSLKFRMKWFTKCYSKILYEIPHETLDMKIYYKISYEISYEVKHHLQTSYEISSQIFMRKLTPDIVANTVTLSCMIKRHWGNYSLHIEVWVGLYNGYCRSNGSLVGILLTHWGRVTHICVSKLTIIGSDYGLLPDRCQAIIWIIAGILLIWEQISAKS